MFDSCEGLLELPIKNVKIAGVHVLNRDSRRVTHIQETANALKERVALS
jgi:hypothetical protein